MSWYLRKSLKIGPLRLNLSKSGLGGSVGIKGLRVGAGPRGRYLHAGRDGLYYRTSLDEQGSRLEREPAEAPPGIQADGTASEPIGPTVEAAPERGRNQLGMRLLRGLGALLKGR